MGELGHVLAHELAQPLSSMVGNAATALHSARSCPHQSCGNTAVLQDLLTESTRMRWVLQTLRALARGQPRMQPRVDLNGLISDIVQRHSRNNRTRRVVVRRRLGAGLPGVWMDPIQMQQVIWSLLDNACDALLEAETSRPTIEIHTRAAGDKAVEVAVYDNGPGVPAALLPRLSYDLVTTKAGGTGLGLILCRTVIEQHHGTLTAENHCPHGTTMRIRLPIRQEKTS